MACGWQVVVLAIFMHVNTKVQVESRIRQLAIVLVVAVDIGRVANSCHSRNVWKSSTRMPTSDANRSSSFLVNHDNECIGIENQGARS